MSRGPSILPAGRLRTYAVAHAQVGWPQASTRPRRRATPACADVHPASAWSRLILQPVNEARAPFWTTEGDYSVIWRSTKVGRISYDHKPYGHGTRLDARPYASRFGLRVLSLSCCGASFREAREKPSSRSRPPTPRRIRTAIRKYDARLAVFRLQLQQSRFAFRNGPAKKLRRVLDGPA